MKATTLASDVRSYVAGIVLASMLVASGCAGRSGEVAATVHQMGEHVQTGALIYTVLEVEWLNQLGTQSPKSPEHKFAVLRLSITNSGNREMSVPLLQIEDEKGNRQMELAEARGVEEWLGVLRTISPAETLQGKIVFDLNPQNHRLRVTNAAEPDQERFAYVTIPLRLDATPPIEKPVQ